MKALYVGLFLTLAACGTTREYLPSNAVRVTCVDTKTGASETRIYGRYVESRVAWCPVADSRYEIFIDRFASGAVTYAGGRR